MKTGRQCLTIVNLFAPSRRPDRPADNPEAGEGPHRHPGPFAQSAIALTPLAPCGYCCVATLVNIKGRHACSVLLEANVNAIFSLPAPWHCPLLFVRSRSYKKLFRQPLGRRHPWRASLHTILSSLLVLASSSPSPLQRSLLAHNIRISFPYL